MYCMNLDIRDEKSVEKMLNWATKKKVISNKEKDKTMMMKQVVFYPKNDKLPLSLFVMIISGR